MNAESEAIVAAGYDAVYRAVPRSPTLWRIWLDHAAGTDFPGEFSHISFVTLAELGALATGLRLGADATVVDLACGMGGPALWVATQFPVRVVGVDASPVAVELATARADRLGLTKRAAFRFGTFAATGLPAGAAGAAFSLDALQYAPSKADAFREIARVLEPGGRMTFTAFEVFPERVADLPVLGDDPVDDYRPILEGAGFEIETYEETQGWTERVTATYEAIVESAAALTAEMGADAFGSLAIEVALTLERKPYRRRVVVTARRKSFDRSDARDARSYRRGGSLHGFRGLHGFPKLVAFPELHGFPRLLDRKPHHHALRNWKLDVGDHLRELTHRFVDRDAHALGEDDQGPGVSGTSCRHVASKGFASKG